MLNGTWSLTWCLRGPHGLDLLYELCALLKALVSRAGSTHCQWSAPFYMRSRRQVRLRGHALASGA